METQDRPEDREQIETGRESHTVREEQSTEVRGHGQESREDSEFQEGTSEYLSGDNLRAWSSKFTGDEQFEREWLGHSEKQETEDWF